MPEPPPSLLFTCEHASHRIPAAYQIVARRAGPLLQSHRGFDPGTATLGRHLSRHFKAPLVLAQWSRLLVELNRSLHHPRLWSEFSRPLPPGVRSSILQTVYHPHRQRVEALIGQAIARGNQVVHIGVHSFTPQLDGHTRRTSVGLLYDPARPRESAFCLKWKQRLHDRDPALLVRRNDPYRGAADGLTTHLRKRFPAARYLGIELEVNQKFPLAGGPPWSDLIQSLTSTLQAATKT